MDFGAYTSLKGFFGTSEKKAQKQQELAIAERLLQQQEQDMRNETNYRLQQQNIIDESNQLAQQVIKGKGVRKKDKDAVQNYAQEIMTPINDMIKKYGSYERAVAAGLDRLVADYSYKIQNNPIVTRLNANQENLSKLFQAKASGEGTHSQLFPSDLAALQKYQAGEGDYITYKGLMDPMQKSDFLDNLPVNQRVDINDFYQYNKVQVRTNYYRDTGIDPDTVPETYILDWYRSATNFDERVATFGKQQIETTPGTEIVKLLQGSPVISDPANQDYKSIFEGGTNGSDIAMDSIFGYDDDTPPPTKNGIQLNASGRIFSNAPNIEFLILGHQNGGENGRLERRRDGGIEINDKQSKGLFNFRGDEIKDNDIGFFDVESDSYDLKYQGMFIAQKVFGTNKDTGEKETFLLTKGNKSKMEEIKRNYSGLQFTSTIVAAYEESDIIFDDVYYEEIKMTESLLATLASDKNVNDAFSTVKNQLAGNNQLREFEAEKQKSNIKVKEQLATLYAGGMEGGADQLYSAFGQNLNVGLVSIGIDSKMLPLVFATLLENVNLDPNDPEARPADELRKDIESFGLIASSDSPEIKEYYEMLKSGDANAFFRFLQQSDPDNAEKIKKRAKLWSKYLKNR